MSSRDVRQVGAVGAEVVAPLGWLARLDTLEDVLRRGLTIVDVVVQDEYTHDVVTRHGAVHVVFDTT